MGFFQTQRDFNTQLSSNVPLIKATRQRTEIAGSEAAWDWCFVDWSEIDTAVIHSEIMKKKLKLLGKQLRKISRLKNS